MRHKTARAYMYGYTTHSKPQGYTSRPPLLTTNKVVYELALKIRNRIMTSFDNMWRERNNTNTKHQPNLRKETDEQIRQI